MKKIQGTFLSGYVTISVTGNFPEQFFDQCAREGMIIWNIKRLSERNCEANIKLRDIPSAKEMSERLNYELYLKEKRGIPFLFKLFLRRKELVTAFIISTLFILLLSNIIWTVEVTGVSKEIEQKINDQLYKYGVHPGSWVFTLDSPSAIQQNLTNDIPELLWIGVERKGTTYKLEGVEKIIVQKEAEPSPRHLIATKSAVIQKMFVKNGVPKVKVNEFVNKGDMLVSGMMSKNNDMNVDEETNDEDVIYVAAEGEIIGKTWYEVKVTIPLNGHFEMLTGEYEESKFIRIGKLMLPYWGFKKPEFTHLFDEVHENQLYFLNWELPIATGKTIYREKVYNTIKRTKEEAIELGIKQAIKELTLQLGPNIQILTENVLHETIDSGKVNLTLFITVEEDIVKTEPIIQGD